MQRREIWASRRKNVPSVDQAAAGAACSAANIVVATMRGTAAATKAASARGVAPATRAAESIGAAPFTGAAAPARAAAMGLAAIRAVSTGAAATGAAVQEAAPPAKRRKPAVCASRASALYAVVSKRRDRCLSGSSPLESPDEEMKEKEMEKEREEEVEVGQRKEEGGSFPSGFRSHPFPISKGLLVLVARQQIMIPHILSVFVVVSKFHEMNI
jgi:hypothetical protein